MDSCLFQHEMKLSLFYILFIYFFTLKSLCRSNNHLWLQYIIIIIYLLEFFTSALADGFSLESEWQQVSSSLQDFSQYSGRSQ